MIAEISQSGDRDPKPDNPCHSLERSQMLPSDSEAIERGNVSRVASGLDVELGADLPDEFRRSAFRRKHPSQKKQIAHLHRFRACAEWLGRRRELDATFLQPLLGAFCRLPFACVRPAIYVQDFTCGECGLS